MPQDSALPWSNHTEWLPVSLRGRLELGVVAHTCDPRTQEAEAGEMSTQGWSWLHSNSLLKKRKKNRTGESRMGEHSENLEPLENAGSAWCQR